MNRKIKAIITGSTGMVGEGFLLECLQHSDVESILVINRRPCGISHSKLKEIIHADFFDLTPVESRLSGIINQNVNYRSRDNDGKNLGTCFK